MSAALANDDAGSQGRVYVPLPEDRPPTDWERNVAGLQSSAWITADMIYRRSVLDRLGGFDERFKRAYREDADFALRVFRAGYAHRARNAIASIIPCGPQTLGSASGCRRGNADDVLMRALHGPIGSSAQARRAGAGRIHLATVACFTAWAALTAEFAWRRIKPGPRTPEEIGTVVVTSAVIPFAAVYHRARALLTLRSRLRGAGQ